MTYRQAALNKALIYFIFYFAHSNKAHFDVTLMYPILKLTSLLQCYKDTCSFRSQVNADCRQQTGNAGCG